MFKKILVLFASTYICLTNICGQTPPQSSKSVKHIKIECNSDYSIDYIRTGQRVSIFSDERANRIWLRLTNTSKKTLKFQAFTGEETANYLKGIGTELDFYYEVIEKENCNSEDKEIKEHPTGYTRAETYLSVNLKPGKSLIFSVAQQYLSPKRAIYITYKCIRGCNKEEKDKLQKAYYFASELPETAK